MKRTIFAFRANASHLAEEQVYFWTFTMQEAVDYSEFRKRWNKFQIYLRRQYPGWAGVRVFEVHPGLWGEFSHGLHCHLLTNTFCDANEVRSIARRCGFGHSHVKRVKGDRRRMVGYLAKYLSKPRSEALKGFRLWQSFGIPDQHKTLCCDVEIDSRRGRIFRWLALVVPGWQDLPWNVRLCAVERTDWKALRDGLDFRGLECYRIDGQDLVSTQREQIEFALGGERRWDFKRQDFAFNN